MSETGTVSASQVTSIDSVSHEQSVQKDRVMQFLEVTGKTKELSMSEIEVFIQKCMIYQLDPFNDEIYPIATGKNEYRKIHFIISYHSLIKKATNSGKLAGWKVTHSGSIAEGNLEAHIVIHRKDFEYPYEYSISYKEFVGTSPIWQNKPLFMLEKCVTAIGMRNCFADVMGQVYIQEEFDVEPVTIREQPQSINTRQRKSKADKIIAKIEPTDYEIAMSIINSATTDEELSRSIPYAKNLEGEQRSYASEAYMRKSKELASEVYDVSGVEDCSDEV